MEFTTISDCKLATTTSACILVGIFANKKLSPSAEILDKASAGFISHCLKLDDFNGEVGQSMLLYAVPHLKAERILLVGCGPKETLTVNVFQQIVRQSVQQLHQTQAKNALCCLTELVVANHDAAWQTRVIVETMRYHYYAFDELKSQIKPAKLLKKVSLCVDASAVKTVKKSILEAQAIADGMELTRNLGNLPANICTPTYLAQQAKKLAKNYQLKCDILDEAAMQKLGMNAFLSVSRGSNEAAKLISLEYQGAKKNKKPIVLIGKGVTFDSGGISLKPSENMEHMKYDMAGAASVLGTLQAIAQLKLPINVVGLIPATENMPSGLATKPGDIVKSLSGQTIEIINTDAEGRLILCDALTYCKKFDPAIVIDIATLTGAIVVSLGHHLSGLFTQDDDLAEAFLKAGQYSNDLAWRMPLLDIYQPQMDSRFADMVNSGGRFGGSILAACFLARFTKEYRWLHLDVAGTAMGDGKSAIATGRPVPSLTQFLLDIAKN